jgi:anti-sigma factor RsiW
MTERIVETELHAFIDGELSPARHAAFAEAMARDPGLAGRVAAYQRDKAAIAAAFGSLADQPVPPALLAAAYAGPPARPAVRHVRKRILLLGVACAAAVVLIVLARRPSRDDIFAQALSARLDTHAPERRLNGQDPAVLEAAAAVMSAMLGTKVQVPDLGRAGFRLVSTEIYGDGRADAVQLRYEDVAHRLFTVYLRPSDGADRFEVTERGSVRLCLWRNVDLTAVMTGQMSTPELFRLASLSYSALGL